MNTEKWQMMKGRVTTAIVTLVVASTPMLALAADPTAETYGLPTIIASMIVVAGLVYTALGAFVTLIGGAEIGFGYLWRWIKKAGGGR
jgi:hypothetical protein